MYSLLFYSASCIVSNVLMTVVGVLLVSCVGEMTFMIFSKTFKSRETFVTDIFPSLLIGAVLLYRCFHLMNGENIIPGISSPNLMIMILYLSHFAYAAAIFGLTRIVRRLFRKK